MAIVFIFGGLFYVYYPDPTEYKNPKETEPVACTMDAKLCPDGSYVGRVAPNCEFADCPIPEGAIMEDGTASTSTSTTSDETIFCAADVKLCPDGSYVSRIPPKCDFKQCP